MIIEVEQYTLQRAIDKAEKIIQKSAAVILESVLLVAQNNKITLTSYNLVSSITIEVDGYVEENGSVLIDKSNFKLIKKLSGRLTIRDLNEVVTIKGNRELKFKQWAANEYPELNMEVNDEAFTITESEFKNSLKIKAFASYEEARPVLASCCIMGNRIVALDGYKLAKIDLAIDNQCKENMMIPIQSITELDKILDKKSTRGLKFEYDINTQSEIKYLKITGDDYYYITRLIAGEYIKIDQIIPQEFKVEIQMDKTAIKESVEFAKEILNSTKLPIKFNITDEFKVSATSDDKEFNEVITSTMSDNTKDFRIGFDPKYLIEIFKTITDEDVTLKFGSPISPMVITGDKTKNELYLVLPIRLKE